MSDDGDEKETGDASKQLIVRQLHFASAFVTPFAASVAAELEEFGLTKQKIDEIMLRSARRFGAIGAEAPHVNNDHETDSSDASGDYFGWFKSASGQAYDFLASVVAKHGPDLVDKIAPFVKDALQQALSNYLNDAIRSNGGTRPRRRTRR